MWTRTRRRAAPERRPSFVAMCSGLLLALARTDLGEHITRVEDQVVLTVERDLGAAVLRVDDRVTGADVHRDDLAGLLGAATRTDSQDLALLGLLLGGVWDDQAARRLRCGFCRA